MKRASLASGIVVCLILLSLGARARLGFMEGGFFSPPPPTISGVALSNGNTFTTPAGAGSTIDAISATCSVGVCTGATFALSTSGSCSGATANGSFAISGTNLNIGGSTNNAGSYSIGIAVTLVGATNSGTCYPLTLTGQAQTIASIAPSSCTFTQGTSANCAVSVTMSPASPSFVVDSGTVQLVSSGGSCSGGDTSHFGPTSATGSPYQITYNGSATAGSYTACVKAAASGITSAYQQVAITVNSNSGPNPPAAATAGCSSSNGGGPGNGSCFTTLALNLDFTGQTTSSDPSRGNNSFNGAVIGNDVNCSENYSSTPLIENGNAPCSDKFITTDSNGKTALQTQWTPQDQINQCGSNPCSTQTSPGSQLVSSLQGGGGSFVGGAAGTFPAAYYFEARLAALSSFVNQASCLCGGPWFWGDNGPDYQEEDFDEWYLPDSRNFILQNVSNMYGDSSGYGGLNIASQFGGNYTQWYTIGMRKTVSGGNAEVCGYFNNVQLQCASETDNSSFTSREGLVIWSGGADANQTITGTQGFQFEWIHVWDCSTWWQNGSTYTDGTGCNGSLISSNP